MKKAMLTLVLCAALNSPAMALTDIDIEHLLLAELEQVDPAEVQEMYRVEILGDGAQLHCNGSGQQSLYFTHVYKRGVVEVALYNGEIERTKGEPDFKIGKRSVWAISDDRFLILAGQGRWSVTTAYGLWRYELEEDNKNARK